jgi:23S rRNA (pseudouridine1915-N3)-methyltransferase
MKLRNVALVQRMPGWVDSGFDEYARRLPRELPLKLIEIKPQPRERGRSVAQMLAAEATRIESASTGFRTVALDEHGDAWSTREFANRLREWRNAGADVAFIIGSADGLADAVKSRAAALVALSAMTLPHGLARVVLAEQIYRAVSLLGGHPYHRD